MYRRNGNEWFDKGHKWQRNHVMEMLCTYNDSQRTGPLNNDIFEYCKIDQQVHHPYDMN
jgi:hypothetical protein